MCTATIGPYGRHGMERQSTEYAGVDRQDGTTPRVLFVCSSGGHLDQLLRLDPWSRDKDRLWVTFPLPDARSRLAGERVLWAHWPTTRSIPNLLRNAALAWRTIRRERPDLIVSTGAGVAVPFFVAARLLGVPTAYLEVYDRFETRTLTGRLCRPFATRFLVQWQSQAALYPGSLVVGQVYA
jgi:hypothetical protein